MATDHRSAADQLRAFADSPKAMGVIVVVVALLMIIATFEAGRSFGLREAHRVGAWSENYARNFGRPTGPGFGPHSPFPGGHGAEGTIAEIQLPTFTVVDDDYPEQTVRVNVDTIIRGSQGNVASTTLAVGEDVIVLGAPDTQGVINAKLIRITPARKAIPAIH